MLTHEKETMLNKVLQLENWFMGYLETDEDIFDKEKPTNKKAELLQNIYRNLNSIKSLIKKS